MKQDFKQQFKMISIASAIALTACSDGEQFVGGIDAPIDTFTASFSGRASKGVLANADCIISTVAATPVTLFSSVDESDACTGSNGRYSIILSTTDETDYDDPISVEIRARATTTYKCDLPASCESGAVFGADVPITDSTFSLKAIVPQITRSGDTVTTEVSVTPWSSVAAERAEALVTAGSTLTTEEIIQANRETAAVLNNILGLEGDDGSFDENFLTLDLLDITDPSSDTIDAEDEALGTLLSFASASILSLVDETGSTNTSIAEVLRNLTSAFEDGVFDVNSSASNTEDGLLGIDLTSITTGISTVLETIDDVVDATDLQVLNENLGGDTNTNKIEQKQTEVESIAETKESVTDANEDTSAPLEVPDDTLTADQKALDMAIQLDNAITAFSAIGDTTHGSNTAIEDIDELLRVSSDDVVEIIENLSEVATMAAELLEDDADPNGDLANSIGCTVNETTTTCTTAQAAILLSDDSPFVGNAEGTFVITKATNTMVVSGLVLSADGNEYGMIMVGDGQDPETATSATYQITAATVDIGDDGDMDVTVGASSTFSVMVSDATENPDTESISLVLDDVMISIPDTFTLDVDIALTQQIILDGVDLDDTLFTLIDFDGTMTNERTNDSLTATNGNSVDFELRIAVDNSTLDGSNLPELGEDGGETSTSFLSVETGRLMVSSPVAYSKRSTTNYTSTDQVTTTETFKIELDFTRTAAMPIAAYDLELTLLGSSGIDRVLGTITNGDAEDTVSLTNGVPGVAAILTVANFTSDTAAEDEFGGSVTVDGVAEGTIGSGGLYTQEVEGSTPITFQLSVND